MPTHLTDFETADGNDGYTAFAEFLQRPIIANLVWPLEVVRQFLWDHGSSGHFVADCGHNDLEAIRWAHEVVEAAQLAHMPTGASDQGYLEEVAREHRHRLDRRKHRPSLVEAGEHDGTWLVPPLIIEQSLVDPGRSGLQVLEGRTRLGILRGRRGDGLHVAERHSAWVGRKADNDGSR